MASASRPPTPWIDVSARNASRSAAEPESEQGPGVLADLQFGEDQHLAADRANRAQCLGAQMDEIADSGDVDHRAVGGGFSKDAGEARNHLR